MKIFGGLLPFIGFRTWRVDNDGFPILKYEIARHSKWEADFFMIEWFFRGWILFSTEVREVAE